MFLDLPERTSKPRREGLTTLHEVGFTTHEMQHILHDYHPFVDLVKLGIGSAYITPHLRDKIALYKTWQTPCYFGGTLFEKAYHQSKLTQYFAYLKDLEIDWLEISTGTVDIPLQERIKVIREWREDFKIVAEVGKKVSAHQMEAAEWINEMHGLLDAGAEYVVAEGRSSGTSGIYFPDREINLDLVTAILGSIPAQRVIFEAPHPASQTFFINHLGANVNLGNISPRDILLLESQRCGLKSETFFISQK